MEIAFLLKKLITQLILPPFNLLLVIVLGLLLLKRRPRTARAMIWASTLCLLVLATPAVSRLLMNSLYHGPQFDAEAARTAGAIVVLGGGLRMNTPEFGSTPSTFTLDRIRFAATVAKKTGLPLLTTGGAVYGPPAEGTVMARVLQDEFATPVKWVEDKALDTADNMKYSAEMLKGAGIGRVVLVTHDIHMRRSMLYCEKSGLECIPAPVSFSGRRTGNGYWFNELPSAGSLYDSSFALYESVGYLAALLK